MKLPGLDFIVACMIAAFFCMVFILHCRYIHGLGF